MSVPDPAEWRLHRHPTTRDRSLRAFDAADQLALGEIAALARPGSRALVVNDGFGGLAVPLVAAGCEVVSWGDSVLAETALARNLEENGLGPVPTVPSTEPPEGRFDVVVVKVPKTLAFLEEQLVGLRSCVDANTTILGAGMVRHIHTSTLGLFERAIGPTVTSLAKKKARLIHPTLDGSLQPEPPDLIRYVTDAGVVCVNRANVFSHGKLDIGTRLLLDHLPDVVEGSAVVDLGCGNGVLGASVAVHGVPGRVTFCDISHAAVASAEATWNENLAADDRATFSATDLAAGVPDASVDLVVINPPFHDQHVVGDDTAVRMFAEARRVLRDGGEVRVVGNRHLGYHKRLGRLFGDVETVGSNPKFVVLSSRKQPRGSVR